MQVGTEVERRLAVRHQLLDIVLGGGSVIRVEVSLLRPAFDQAGFLLVHGGIELAFLQLLQFAVVVPR